MGDDPSSRECLQGWLCGHSCADHAAHGCDVCAGILRRCPRLMPIACVRCFRRFCPLAPQFPALLQLKQRLDCPPCRSLCLCSLRCNTVENV